MQAYRTIQERATGEFVERRSRFIGTIAPAATEEQALSLIEEMRTTHRDASHNIYAYLLREGQLKRYTDDGEPQGTAGIPALDVLQKEGLVDVCVVVTRYFGGILLGAGGLVRAYSHGVRVAVEAAKVVTMCPATVLELDLDYGLYGKVTHLLPKFEILTQRADFGVAVKLQLLVQDAYLEAFQKELTEVTAATVFPYEVEKRFASFSPQ